MTNEPEKIEKNLKSIAGITLNYRPDKPKKLAKAAEMLSQLDVDDSNPLRTLFTSTKNLTISFIKKIVKGDEKDIDPVNDGICLLRAIVRSIRLDNDFAFDDKDIQSVIENLETIKIEVAQEDVSPDSIEAVCTDINTLYKICLGIEDSNIDTINEAVELLKNLTIPESSPYAVMFSSVREMAIGYLQKMPGSKTEDPEPLFDAILLLRAIAKSEKNHCDFPFENKDILSVVNNLGYSDSEGDSFDENADIYSRLIKIFSELETNAPDIDTDDLPSLGQILNRLEESQELIVETDLKAPLEICQNLRTYIGRLILGDHTDISVIGESFRLIKAMIKADARGETFPFDYSDITEKLCAEPPESEREDSDQASEKETAFVDISPAVKDLNEDDVEVLEDFLIESRDNLETIEVNLIDLEQSPDDSDIINAIFRPFHTIKGVSGFLDLRKINALSHSTENLLDSARDGNFTIDHTVTDIVLKSVDVLKQLIDRVDHGLEKGRTADDGDIEIASLIERIEETNAFYSSGKSGNRSMGEILVDNGCANEEDIQDALKTQEESPGKKLGEILVEKKVVDSREVISALREQKRGRKQAAPQVKVDTGKLDNLVDLTGELVIAQSMLKQNSMKKSGSDQKFQQNLSHLAQIVSNIQKISMSMRMVPINATFQKMVRLVRDLSRSCKKEVHLEMIGEETEIDRNVVEALYEPMVHMIRNSIDHGLETREEREATGKPGHGKVSLRAYHKGGNIVIEITDDGRGLSRLNILEKALQNGIITGEEDMTDEEIYNLVMAPGFSTAAKITDISGRGVGMDVVKKAIENLNGRIDIQSEEGKGSTFTISLPLTLAIIEGMLVRVGKERFIIPTMAILESFRPTKEDYYTIEQKGEMLRFRDKLIPLIRLNQICNVDIDNEEVWNGIIIVVENKNDQRGILIDELLGKEEFVIKSLGESLNNVRGLAGGAILGDGRVGLIIDINGIFNVSDNR